MGDEAPRPELRIAPEPSEQEREAIAAALARVSGGRPEPGKRGSWWHEGVRESVAPPPARPRRS